MSSISVRLTVGPVGNSKTWLYYINYSFRRSDLSGLAELRNVSYVYTTVFESFCPPPKIKKIICPEKKLNYMTKAID